MEQVTPISADNLAALLGIYNIPLTIVLGKPRKNAKSVKTKKFSQRVQKGK